MTGIEILSVEEVAVKFTFNWNAYWIAVGVAFALFLVAGILSAVFNDDISDLIIYVMAGIIILPILCIPIGHELGTPTQYETQYKVIISDEVSMNDFLKKNMKSSAKTERFIL